jgi:two-component sensor histidine kinase
MKVPRLLAPRSLTLTQRLFLLTAVALLPAFLILLYNLVILRETQGRDGHSAALQAGQIASLEIDRIIFGSEDVLRALASAPVLRDFDSEGCSQILHQVDLQLVRFSQIRLLDADGVVRCSSERPVPSLNLADRDYFRDAMASGTFSIGTYAEDRADGHRVLPLALPIYGDDGAISSVIVGTLDLDWLGNRIRERDFHQNNALTIADRNGTIIAREPFPEQFVGTTIPERFMELVNDSLPGTREVTSQDGTVRIIGYVPARTNPSRLYVSAGISRDVIFQPIEQATMRGLMIAVAGLLLAVLFAWLTGRALVRRPVHRLLTTIEAWRRGDETARTGMAGNEGELGAVAKAVDEYMDELVADRRKRREAEEHRELLLRELDHRIKNILATVQAIARQTFRDDVPLADAMTAYSERLGTISRAHQLLISNSWRSASLRDVVETAVSPFRSAQKIRFSLQGPSLVVQSRAALALSMALHELCTNSVKYGALGSDDGTVSISWSAEQTTDGGTFRFVWVEKDGPAVVPPSRTGFGSRMIERMLASEINGEIELLYPSTGVTCMIEARLASITDERPAPSIRDDLPREAADEKFGQPAVAGGA